MDRGQAIFGRVLERCGSDIAELVPIAFDDSVYGSYHHVMAEVEFSALVEEGFLEVGLDYVGFVVAVFVAFFAF